MNKLKQKKIPQILLTTDSNFIEEEYKNIEYCINQGYFSIWIKNENYETYLIPENIYLSNIDNSILIEFDYKGNLKDFKIEINKLINSHLKYKETKFENNFLDLKEFDFYKNYKNPYIPIIEISSKNINNISEERERGYSM